MQRSSQSDVSRPRQCKIFQVCIQPDVYYDLTDANLSVSIQPPQPLPDTTMDKLRVVGNLGQVFAAWWF